MTIYWTILDAAGAVVQPCCTTPDEAITPDMAGEPWEDGYQAIQIPEPPLREEMIWDGATWIESLPILKVRKLAAVNARRLVAESAGCNTPFGVVDSDERSRGLISGAALMALIAKGAGQPFAETWTMHDNSAVELDADEMIGMGVAVGLYVSAIHARGVALKAEIDAAGSMAALDAIDIDAGWPS